MSSRSSTTRWRCAAAASTVPATSSAATRPEVVAFAVLLVLDFDGTITDRDTLDFIVEQHAPAVFREAEEALRAGTMTLNEVIAYAVSGPPDRPVLDPIPFDRRGVAPRS